MNKKKFDGSISEIMVAYKPNGDLDFGPVKKMVEFQVENHIDGLFMGGLSTQTYLLSMEEKKQRDTSSRHRPRTLLARRMAC